MPYLSDPKFLAHKGFVQADTAAPYYELLYLPFDLSATVPCLKVCAKTAQIQEQGFVPYYAHQCPFTASYVPLVKAVADEKSIPFKAIRFETAAQAQAAPAPFTSYSLFYNGNFVTNDILSVEKFNR